MPTGTLTNPTLADELLEAVDELAAFLASSDADYITGTTVFVDGGLCRAVNER